MKKSILLITIFLSAMLEGHCHQLLDSAKLHSDKGGWTVTIDEKGSIIKLDMLFKNELVQVPWRKDENGGPAWTGVNMHRVAGSKLLFEGQKNAQVYSLEYQDVNGKFTMKAGLRNEGSKPFSANPSINLTLGIDNEMRDPKAYFGVFFPTLLRCEKTHFWGYFQNPNGHILTVASPDPVASRTIEYISQGHRISTSSLDMMHVLPLPPRHPQGLVQLAPGESKMWTIVLQPVNSIEDVLPTIASICKAPSIGLDRTTAATGEVIEATIHFNSNSRPSLAIYNPSGKQIETPKPVINNNALKYIINAPDEPGNYRITAVANGKQSEAIFHVRKPWGWYLQQARKEALRMQIKPMSHREGWLGFFSAYGAQVYFPDKKLLAETEKAFNNFYSLMVDSAKPEFYQDKATWNDRPQNSSWMVGMMTARYAATGKIEDLEEAARWGDHFIQKFQLPNGAYKGYTALTLGAMFLSQLALHERPLADSSAIWKDRYERHLLSVRKAAANLLEVKDLGDTEGEATYEDTQAGSAWSLLALHALNCSNDSLKKEYLKVSLEIQGRHECLTQALISDGRMRNATLRFWESQYDVLMLPNMMNSPHGWTMRSQFGALYLYLLTGEERFLNLVNNAMGTCVQAINENTGVLRWSFVPDPYIEAHQFVPDPEKPGQGKHIPSIVGEQWIPMISDWWRVPDGELGALTNFKTEGYQGVSQGWSCDNDVHETFRVLAEDFVPNAFVLERADGSLRTMNCKAERKGNTISIELPEKVVSRVHLNLKNKYTVVVPFATETIKQTVDSGMHWVGPGGVPELLRQNALSR